MNQQYKEGGIETLNKILILFTPLVSMYLKYCVKIW